MSSTCPRTFCPSVKWRRVSLVTLLAVTCSVPRAQVSANDELDACMRDAPISGAVTGGAVGAGVGGLLGSLFGGGRDSLNKVLGGAAVGAAVGAIAAWQMAYKSCAARFATASSLITDEYAACSKRMGYTRKGVVVAIEGSGIPKQVRGGERLGTDVSFHVLTPDPKDVPLELTRRFLCKDEDGRFNELASPSERITVSSGCHLSRGSLLLPSKIPAEQVCRMEVTLQAEGQTRSLARDFNILP
jgi:uncharacterized protein YcfJ